MIILREEVLSGKPSESEFSCIIDLFDVDGSNSIIETSGTESRLVLLGLAPRSLKVRMIKVKKVGLERSLAIQSCSL